MLSGHWLVRPARQARHVPQTTMGLTSTRFPGCHGGGHTWSHLVDDAGRLVAEDQRDLGHRNIAVDEVQVRTAYPAGTHRHPHLTGPRFGNRDIDKARGSHPGHHRRAHHRSAAAASSRAARCSRAASRKVGR
ncbi:hypothetical protein AVZ31_02265 [Mycolicibacterium neoaurum]|nr:hypothetical protein AVZ31_02265 [Mycolicibacterium neoaurum]